MPLSDALRLRCEELLQTRIRKWQSVSGGDINEASLLETDSGAFFIKYNDHPLALEMLQTEQRGLDQLAAQKIIKTPTVAACDCEAGTSFLLMDFIDSRSPQPKDWEYFGRSLARLHRCSQEKFGLDHDNFIGPLPQSNQAHSSWSDFYRQERLEPQVERAINSGKMSPSLRPKLEQLYQKLPHLCPKEPPALTHGDLWSGNFLIDKQGQAILIDPSISYAHREMDLGMSMLFGGFAAQFYEAYQEEYPTEGKLNDRLDIYQLYYLLVHVNLFGGSYLGSVQRILNRWV